MKRGFMEEVMQMVTSHMEKYSKSINFRKMQIKTTRRHPNTP
jgi:hypothetical protein